MSQSVLLFIFDTCDGCLCAPILGTSTMQLLYQIMIHAQNSRKVTRVTSFSLRLWKLVSGGSHTPSKKVKYSISFQWIAIILSNFIGTASKKGTVILVVFLVVHDVVMEMMATMTIATTMMEMTMMETATMETTTMAHKTHHHHQQQQ